jgi:hypothetical protein
VYANGLPAIFAAMDAHYTSPGVLERACSVIRNIAADNRFQADLLVGGMTNGFTRVCDVLDRFPALASLQMKAVRIGMAL